MRDALLSACGLLLVVAGISAQQPPAPVGNGRVQIAPAAVDRLTLIEAARNQDQVRVRALLTPQVNVNARSDDGSTALLWAAHWNDLATADLLIRAHADANLANDFGMTPLSRACT